MRGYYCFKDKRSKMSTQEMKGQVFFMFLAMEIIRNNKNNMSWAMALSLAEYSRCALLKSQSKISYFGLKVSNTTVIKHSSSCAKNLKN